MTDLANDPDLGPLRFLVGAWEGGRGIDIAPSDSRDTAKSDFRERMVFTPTGRVDNHEQVLYGLRYETVAWRKGADEPFHTDIGFWLWDAQAGQVMKAFAVPRGISVLAGGSAGADDTHFEVKAELGANVYGICNNLFLEKEFRTLSYFMRIQFNEDGSFEYESDAVLEMPGRESHFHHTDSNTMMPVRT